MICQSSPLSVAFDEFFELSIGNDDESCTEQYEGEKSFDSESCTEEYEEMEFSDSAQELEGSVETRIQQLQALQKQIPRHKMAALNAIEEAKKEFAQHYAWMIQWLDRQNSQPDDVVSKTAKYLVKFDFERFEWEHEAARHEWMSFEERCDERELDLQKQWRNYHFFADFGLDILPRSSASWRLDFIEQAINSYIDDIIGRKNCFIQSFQEFWDYRESKTFDNAGQQLFAKARKIWCYNQVTSECEEERIELRYLLAQAKIWTQETENWSKAGDEGERYKLEKQLAEVMEYSEELKEGIKDCLVGEEEYRSDYCCACDIDEGLVDMA